MKIFLFLIAFFLLSGSGAWAQRKLPAKTKEQKVAEKRHRQNERKQEPGRERSLVWDARQMPRKNKTLPNVSPWQVGTAGIVPSHQGEISLFQFSRIGFSRSTEWLFRLAEEPFLPNIGIKHRWWGNRRLILSTEHTLYYTYPLLKILQHTGFKDLVPDSVRVGQGGAMRNELLFSWLMNPRMEGCPGGAEKVLTFRAGAEFYFGDGKSEVQPFDYLHTLYHSQVLDDKVLYYGGLQLDSYFSYRFRYSLNGLFYSVDFSRAYAVEANLRLTCRISPHLALAAACKGAYIRIRESRNFTCLPLLDLTYFIRPDKVVRRGNMFKSRRH